VVVVESQESNFSAISWRWYDDDNVRLILDQHQYRLIVIESSLKQLSIGMHVAPF